MPKKTSLNAVHSCLRAHTCTCVKWDFFWCNFVQVSSFLMPTMMTRMGEIMNWTWINWLRVLNHRVLAAVSENESRNCNLHSNTAVTVLWLDKLTEVKQTDRLSVHLNVTNAAVKCHTHYLTRHLFHRPVLHTWRLSPRSTVKIQIHVTVESYSLAIFTRQ